MSRFIPTLNPWPLGKPLPTNGLFVFYDPLADDEFRLLPSQIPGAQVGPNLRPDSAKVVRFLTNAESQAHYGGATLEGLLGQNLHLGAEAKVQLYTEHDGVGAYEYDVRMVVVTGPENSPLRVQRDASYAFDSGYPDGLVPAKWVRLSSEEALTANVLAWDVNYNQYGTPPGYRSDDVVSYTFGEGTFTFQALLPGRLPAPSSPSGDANWKRFVPTPPPTQLSQALTLDQASGMDTDNVVAGRAYLITGAWNGGDAAQTVTVEGISNNSFGVSGTVELAGVRQAVSSIDVVAGTFAVGGTVDAYTKAQTDAKLATKGDAATQQQQGGWIGTIANLTTTVKTNLVGAINELLGKLNTKAAISSPAFTGTPTGPTPLAADNSNALATTAFVKANLPSAFPDAFLGNYDPNTATPTLADPPTSLQRGNYYLLTANGAPVTATTTAATNNDTYLTVPRAGVWPGMVVTGTGIPPGTLVRQVGGSNLVVLNRNVTLASGVALTFSPYLGGITSFTAGDYVWSDGVDWFTRRFTPGAGGPGGPTYTAGSGIDITDNVISTKATLRPSCRVSGGAIHPAISTQPAPEGEFLPVLGYAHVEREIGSTDGTGWDAAGQRYIIPATGEYQIGAVGQLQPGVNKASAVFYHIVYVNGQRARDLFIVSAPANTEYYGGGGTTDLSLTAGDIVQIYFWHDGGAGAALIQSNTRAAFSIRQLPS